MCQLARFAQADRLVNHGISKRITPTRIWSLNEAPLAAPRVCPLALDYHIRLRPDFAEYEVGACILVLHAHWKLAHLKHPSVRPLFVGGSRHVEHGILEGESVDFEQFA
jgi:hypothetical protein